MTEPKPRQDATRPPARGISERRLRLVRNLAGAALLLGAGVGLILPLLQGVLMALAGLLLLDLPIKQRLHRRLQRRRAYRRVAGWFAAALAPWRGRDTDEQEPG